MMLNRVHHNYSHFVSRKFSVADSAGIDIELPDEFGLFPHQRDLTSWALRRGRAAIFADTGLGKSRMECAWAQSVLNATGGGIIMLAPLAVADQTIEEGAAMGIEVKHARTADDIKSAGIYITNYERAHLFDMSLFNGVVLDESSIIKHHAAKTLQYLLDVFQHTPYRLCATATPAPNDWTELGNHAQFLGVRSRAEMLAEFFVHDGGETQTWRLKGHARQMFWRWIASWGAMVRSPADLGHDAIAYKLPTLNLHEHIVNAPQAGTQLFATPAMSLMERRDARRNSMSARVADCAEIVNADSNEPWIVWCDLNAEGDALEDAIPDSVQVSGSDSLEEKEAKLRDFKAGNVRVMVSKPSICGFGLNWQHCARMGFVGVTDSFEAYYQAVRRIWRFGQKRECDVHIFASEQEGAVVANLKRKERDAAEMAAAMASETMDAVRENVLGRSKESNDYIAKKKINLPSFIGAQA